jgi:hypothetical protein
LVNFEVATDPEVPLPGGIINPNVAGWYDSGSKIIVEATPDPGFAFKAWSSEGSITFDASGSPAIATIKGPGKIIAIFTPPVDVTIDANVPSAIVNVDGVDYPTPHTFTWGIGSNHIISAESTFSNEPGIRYYFTDWSDGGAQSHQYTVSGPDTVTANYKKQYLVTFEQTGVSSDYTGPVLTVDSTEYGVSDMPALWLDSGSHEFAYNSFLVVDTTKHYLLLSVSSPSPIEVTSPMLVTGTYKTQYWVTFIVNNGDRGTITQTDGWYYAGPLDIVATPIPPYIFLTWSASNPSIIPLDLTKPSTTATIGGSGIIEAYFVEPVEIMIQSNHAGAKIIVDGTEYTTTDIPLTFTWGIGSGHNINAELTFLGEGGIRYYFTDWSDGGAQSHQYIVSGPDTVTANYNTKCRIRFEVVGSGNLYVNGAVVTNGEERWYDAGTIINLEGTPSGKFIGWGGTLTVVPDPKKPYKATHTVSMSGTISLITK